MDERIISILSKRWNMHRSIITEHEKEIQSTFFYQQMELQLAFSDLGKVFLELFKRK